MKTTIFIKSYKRDYPFLLYCLKSIEKFLTGNYDVVLLLDKPYTLTSDFNDILKDRIHIHYVTKTGDGYLFQQYCKMSAYKYTNADYIMFTDSDYCFDKPTNVDELVKDNKPTVFCTDYEKVGDAKCWKAITDKALNEDVKYEFMRRLPLIYHRSTLENLENFFNRPLLSYILANKGFSEFNIIGAYAYYYENDKYDFQDTENVKELPPQLGVQGWTWGSGNETKEYLKQFAKIVE